MPEHLTLSRAARLIGVRRGALQSKIRSGELATFEGMVSVADLQRAYPQASLTDSTELERMEGIKDAAFARRLREQLLPNADVLAARLTAMSTERAQVETRLAHYREIVDALRRKLREIGESGSPRAAAAGLLDWLERHLEPDPHSAYGAHDPHGAQARRLRMQQDLLRIMTAHVQIKPSGHEFFVDGNDSLLEAALRAGLALDYGCSAGSCGKCKARVLSGQVQKTRHSDYVLSAAEKGAGVMLMCCNTAVVDLVIEAAEAHGAADMPLQDIEARVKSISPIAQDMRLLHLQTPRSNRLRFLAGQSVSLQLAGGERASCPVASCPCDDRNLQFHVRRRAGDAFAERVFEGLNATDSVRVEGPRGTFVLDEESSRPLVFIAVDSGFAPIKSLIEHAMALEAAESLSLYWIASARGGHYLDNLCRSWGDALDDFRYVPLTLEGAASREAIERLLQPILNNHPGLRDCDVYVAGPPALAQVAEFALLEHGLPQAQLSVNGLAS
jgi:CDP-4-dehydro-6-deoxyglucose reductase